MRLISVSSTEGAVEMIPKWVGRIKNGPDGYQYTIVEAKHAAHNFCDDADRDVALLSLRRHAPEWVYTPT
jgi:hypothetical protein